jgi:hypothetical protein
MAIAKHKFRYLKKPLLWVLNFFTDFKSVLSVMIFHNLV